MDLQDSRGVTPITMAVTDNNESIVRVLVKLGACLHTTDIDGNRYFQVDMLLYAFMYLQTHISLYAFMCSHHTPQQGDP